MPDHAIRLVTRGDLRRYDQQLVQALQMQWGGRATYGDVIEQFQRSGGPVLTGAAYTRPREAFRSGVICRVPISPDRAGDLPDRDLVFRLFGQNPLSPIAGAFRFSPGSNHLAAAHLGRIHPDNASCIQHLMSEMGWFFDDANVIASPFVDGDLTGSFVCAGGAISNIFTRLALQYTLAGSRPDLGVVRTLSPLTMRYELVQDYRSANDLFGFSRRITERGELVVPNWPVLDLKHDKHYVPSVDDGQILQDDYLLITCVPNLLSSSIFRDKVYIFSGCHGVGTRSAHLLFSNKNLNELLSRIDSPYWQALYRVACVSSKSTGELTPVGLEIVDASEVGVSASLIQSWLDKNNVKEYSSHRFGHIVSDYNTRSAVRAILVDTGIHESAHKDSVVETETDKLPDKEASSIILSAYAELCCREPEVLSSFLIAYEERRRSRMSLECRQQRPLESTVATMLLTEPYSDGEAQDRPFASVGLGGDALDAYSKDRLRKAFERVCEKQPTVALFVVRTTSDLGIDAATLISRVMREYVVEKSVDTV